MVLLCFLKRRVVARESGFACFGGCTSRVKKKGRYSSELNFSHTILQDCRCDSVWLLVWLKVALIDVTQGGESGRDLAALRFSDAVFTTY